MTRRFDPARLTRRRQQAGLSQHVLAIRSGITRKTLMDAENGRTIPRVDTLRKVADQLGCDVGDLFTDDRKEAASQPGP